MELIELLGKYQDMLQDGFINFYRLLKLSRMQTREDLLNDENLKKWQPILVESKFAETGLDPMLKKTFDSLCKAFKQFVEWTLSSDYNKKSYDKLVVENFNKPQPKRLNKKDLITDYRYIFEKTATKPEEAIGIEVRKLYAALECGIKKFGVSITIQMLNNLFKLRNITTLDVDMARCLQPNTTEQDINALIKLLNKKYKASNTMELSEKVVGEMISRKVDVLASALDNTGQRHGYSQIIIGLKRYIQEKDATSISKGTDKVMGREKLMMELDPEFVKIVLAAMDSDKTLLLDFPEYLDREYNDDESLSKIAFTIIQSKNKGFRK